MKLLRRANLGGRLLAILLTVIAIDFAINSVVFQSARQYDIQQEDAAAMAEHILVAHRMIERSRVEDRPAVAHELNTERFTISWSKYREPAGHAIELPTLRSQMLEVEPELRKLPLQLKLIPLSDGGKIGGFTTLHDGSVVNFQYATDPPWYLNFGRVISLAVPSLVLLLLAWSLVRVMLKPLRALVQASSEVGESDPQPIPEAGEGEVLQLIRAFNTMQNRIHQLLASGAQTMLAVSHDLRTPLARLQLRIEDAKIEPELAQDMRRDIDEMRGLLESLQNYVETGKDSGPLERIDIAVTAQTLVDDAQDRGERATYRGPNHLEMLTRPVSVRRALSNLVQNALAYAGNARVEVAEGDSEVIITVDDDGVGIPDERLAEVLLPFIRLDNARTRNTAGMGLGLPIVDRVVAAEGGTLTLANKRTGGLQVTIRLPRSPGG